MRTAHEDLNRLHVAIGPMEAQQESMWASGRCTRVVSERKLLDAEGVKISYVFMTVCVNPSSKRNCR